MTQWKFERREEKLNNRRRQSNAVKVKIPNLSKKDIIIVTGYKNCDPKDKFELELSGKNLIGGKEEFKKIKEQCKAKLKAEIKILEVVSG